MQGVQSPHNIQDVVIGALEPMLLSKSSFDVISFGMGGVDPKNGMGGPQRVFVVARCILGPGTRVINIGGKMELEVQSGERTLVNM